MKKSKYIPLICGLLLVAFTFIVYLLAFDDLTEYPINWVSLIFMLFTECFITAKVYLSKSKINKQAGFIGGIGLFILVTLITLLFVNVFNEATGVYVVLCILFFCLYAFIDVLLLPFSKSVSASDRELAQSQGVMNACYAKVQGLVVVYGQSDVKNDLVEIADLIKYSDNSDLTGDEAVIMAKLDELEAMLKNNSEATPALITEIKNTINLRTIKMKSLKRGGY